MVADTNKQLDLNGEDQAQKSHIGDGGKSMRRQSLPIQGSRKNIVLIAILILFVGAIAHYVFHLGDKVYAQAAGHKIYKKEIKDLIGNTKGVNDHNAAVVLANKYLYQTMAKKGGITVSDSNITAQYPDANQQKNRNLYLYQSDVNAVYYNNLIAYNKGLYKGDALVTNFSRNIEFQSPYSGIQKITNPTLGDPAAIAADKKYAYNLITNLYNEIKSGKITFNQAIQIERNDPQVGDNAYQTLPQSGPFDSSNASMPGTYLISPPSIQKKLANMKTGQLSAPFAVRVGNSWYDKKVTTESYYLVVRMDYTKGSHSGLPFNQYLEKAKKQYGYKINV